VYGGYLAGKLLTPFELVNVKRIAVCLRAPSRLYDRRGMHFFGLQDEGRDAAIWAFDPDVLIAPSQVLLQLAANPQGLRSLRHLYYGAETLNAAERNFVERQLGHRPEPIYQATEGFLGAPCRLGTLHLNEDSFIIETEALGQGRFRPIITDLLRRTQLVIRLRLDDVLRATTCTCGSPLMAVQPIEGRISDIWRWKSQTVFPGDVEAAVQAHVPADRHWVATGHTGGIEFACEDEADVAGVEAALRVFGQPVTRQVYDRAADVPKRRHVRWRS
jgi:putative adenylate-forming enzyme